ncbi:helix-turn-helix domain-containing protein [Hamadaea tsunoensis]|uniref:helix-turn-helix domain-containing protein n=1 Tax=Hamadaea tsunoensis TaxID=53368 RepID=UPI00041E4E50|nr:helix-turn-helix transcriptional regulator [Hamadaea tsunoensis]
MSDNELGLFLRTRREAVTPAQAGLPVGPRRRAAGLRRSEVAALADVSVEYVIRLEQGRDRHPSPQVLSALADALRLTASERTHLYRLTKSADPGFNCRGATPPVRPVRPTVQALLDRLEPAPALLLNQLGDVLAYTTGFQRIAGPAGLLGERTPNLPRFVFGDPRAREVFPDWSHVADEQVAALKNGPFRADPGLAALADELAFLAGEEFTRRVATLPGLPASHGILRWNHAEAGMLRLAYEVLDLAADDNQRLLAYLPADEGTQRALDRLNHQGLRLVG